MSNDELYEVARERIDRRNRRKLRGLDLVELIIYLGFFMLMTSTGGFSPLILFGFLAWIGVFTLHCILLGAANSRDSDIEVDAAKLRAVGGSEKPKRLEPDADDEMVEQGKRGQYLTQR
ncbi:MAG: hypothetical protein U0694_03555 [Anaerolineae bacterium]